LWANVGSQQFHLSEGDPDAQVFDGVVTLAYESLDPLAERCEGLKRKHPLKDSSFEVMRSGISENELSVTDPWGNRFRLVADTDGKFVDDRGTQPGEKLPDSTTVKREAEPVAMTDLTVHVPRSSNVAGIARFYEYVLGAPILSTSVDRCVVSTGGRQTLTFVVVDREDVHHEDLLRHDDDHDDEDFPFNAGAHVSMYVANLRES